MIASRSARVRIRRGSCEASFPASAFSLTALTPHLKPLSR